MQALYHAPQSHIARRRYIGLHCAAQQRDSTTVLIDTVLMRDKLISDITDSQIASSLGYTPLPSVYTVPDLIPVLGSQPAGNGSHKPSGRLPLLSARPAVAFAALKRAATNFAAW